MSDNSDPTGGHRPPRDMPDLLKICMEAAARDPNPNEEPRPLDADRRQWLSEALQSMTTDVVKEMQKAIEVIKTGLSELSEDGLLSEEVVQRIESAVDVLIDYTGSLDNARDFHTIGGFVVFRPLLESDSAVLKCKACELLAEVVQNEVKCQSYAMDDNLLDVLVRLLDSDPNESVRVKSLYAISCLIRDNDSAQQVFESQLDGLSVLLRAIDSSNPLSKDNKLRIKASFLMQSLCRRKPSVCDSLYELGVLSQLVGLLKGDHDSSHEHLLAALYSLVSTHDRTRQDCRRPEWALKSFLKTRIDQLKGREEFLEESEYCRRLLEEIFVDKDLPESER